MKLKHHQAVVNKATDGQYIAFSVLTGIKERFMVMKADGSGLKEFCEGSAPSWFDPAFVRGYAISSAEKLANTAL